MAGDERPIVDNPTTKITLGFQDGCTLSFRFLKPVPQVKIMAWIGKICGESGNPLDMELADVVVSLGPMAFEFGSFQDWMDTAKVRFARAGLGHETALCVDAKGRICRCGREFRRAEEEKTYPVKVYPMGLPSDTVEHLSIPSCTEGDPCCDRRGQYNGFGSGPLLFECPKHCSCHD